MEENKKYVWLVFADQRPGPGLRPRPVFLGGALNIDQSGHLLTTIFGSGRQIGGRTPTDISVRSPQNNDYNAHLIQDWSRLGLLLYQVVGEPEEVFDFLNIDEGSEIDVDDEAFCFLHQSRISHGFLTGLCSYPSPDIEWVSDENPSCGHLTYDELNEFNFCAVERSPPHRMLHNILDVRTYTALPLLSELPLDLPLLQFSGFGRLTQDTYDGSSGCPVFRNDNMKLVGLILFYKNAECLVVPLNIIQQAKVVLPRKITLKNKDDIEEENREDEGKDSGSRGSRARRHGQKGRGSQVGGGRSMGESSTFRSCTFSALESLVAGLWRLDKTWNSAVHKVGGTFYVVQLAPESHAGRTVMKSQNSVFLPDESDDLEHEMEDGTGRGQTTVQVGKLGRNLFVMSHVAMHQLAAYHESCVTQIHKQKQKAEKDRQDGGIKTELGVTASEDAILYALGDRAEREMLSGASHEENLLGYCAPSLSKFCINFNLMQKGGFDMICSGRDKIETPEQFKQAEDTAVKLKDLDGLVAIGGDDSNTNACLLAENFRSKNLKGCVIGCPKTIDGDLKCKEVPTSFGFDTWKIYAEMIGNVVIDARSTGKKYYHFVRLMGRAASHITLECAVQTHPNISLIGEEVFAKNQTLKNVTDYMVDIICKRAESGFNYGVILIPEGLIDFIPEVQKLIAELNEILTHEVVDDAAGLWKKKLTTQSVELFDLLPQAIQEQLMLERDPHGNVQVAKIETEKMLIQMVETELEKRREQGSYKGQFRGQSHFFGYEGRCGLPTNFDSSYCYALGYAAGALLHAGKTGLISSEGNLAAPVEEWTVGRTTLTSLMDVERRYGKLKPVIKKAMVELEGAPFKKFASMRDEWALNNRYIGPDPIQFVGPTSNAVNHTVLLELGVQS